MKNFSRCSYHGSKRRELAQHAHTWIARIIHSQTYINTVTTTLYKVPVQLLQNLESIFLFWRYLINIITWWQWWDHHHRIYTGIILKESWVSRKTCLGYRGPHRPPGGVEGQSPSWGLKKLKLKLKKCCHLEVKFAQKNCLRFAGTTCRHEKQDGTVCARANKIFTICFRFEMMHSFNISTFVSIRVMNSQTFFVCFCFCFCQKNC